MNVYALGAARDGAMEEVHQSVLRSRLPAIWGPDCLMIHGEENAVFLPEECLAVLVAGGTLMEAPEDVQPFRNYPRAMRWFSEATAGMSIGVADEFRADRGQSEFSAIESLRILTVRDTESARILRQSGVRTPVLLAADLAYLQPVMPRMDGKLGGMPVLGVVTPDGDESLADVVRELEADFEIRYVSPSTFDGIDVCLTTHLQGVILSVLHQIPFAAIPAPGETIARECSALDYPLNADVRSVWSERSALRAVLKKALPARLRLAQRSIDLMHAMFGNTLPLPHDGGKVDAGESTLVVWAAPDEYWDEAETLLSRIGSGFDCLVPAGSHLRPSRAQKRMALPAGALMHWAMFPEELKSQIEQQYDNTIVCHPFTGSKDHLSDIAARTGRFGRHGWEFRLWTHSCESYS